MARRGDKENGGRETGLAGAGFPDAKADRRDFANWGGRGVHAGERDSPCANREAVPGANGGVSEMVERQPEERRLCIKRPSRQGTPTRLSKGPRPRNLAFSIAEKRGLVNVKM